MTYRQRETTAPSVEHRRLLESLRRLPEPVAHPVLVAVSGLPGTGKSYFSQRLAEYVSLAMLETDALRKKLSPSPKYSAAENGHLFQCVHELIEELLERRIPVLLDATNLVERHRRRLYSIADRWDAKLVLVLTEAPLELVQKRLSGRAWDDERSDHSDANWEVYKRMRRRVEPIGRSHYVVNTAGEIGPVVDTVVKEITVWMHQGR